MSNKNHIKKIELVLLAIAIISSLSLIAYSIPNSLTLQGKLTNLAGASQQGNFNFTFAIYDNATSGNKLWEIINTTLTTDANGVYDVILTSINLSFADQYYLGITVVSDNESSPRINLTSAPYSFRANTSESLNPNASYFVTNISVSGHATIGNGTTNLEISTRGFNFSTVTGNLNINGTVTAKSFAGDGSQLTGLVGSPFNSSGTSVYFNDTNANLGLGISNPSDRLVVIGSARISGSLNASSINASNITALNYYIGWTNLSDYPSACPSGQFITTLGDTITCESPSLSSAGGWTDDGATIRLTTFSDSVLIGTNVSGEKLIVNGSFRVDNSTTAVFFVNASAQRVGIGTTSPDSKLHVIGGLCVEASDSGCPAATGNLMVENNVGIGATPSAKLVVLGNLSINDTDGTSRLFLDVSSGNVGIGTTSPNDKLEAVGNVRISGSLNATSINASQIYIGTTPVQKSSDFNLGNISNYTQFTKSADFNLGNISNYTQYTKSADFNLGNISNYTQFTKSADFNIGNISNDTLRASANTSIAFWNLSNATGGRYITLRDSALLVRIGYINETISNDTLSVFGTVAVYGSLNATSINASQIYIGTKQVQASADFNLGNISNYTQYTKSADFNLGNISNYTQFTKSADFNLGNISNHSNFPLSNFQLANVSNHSNFPLSNFQLGNVSNDTLKASANASIAFWNLSNATGGKYVTLRDSSLLVRIGYVNETISNDTLSVFGTVAVYGSLNATFINATQIYIGTKQVQASSDFNLGNISNYTQFTKSADFNLGNISNYTQFTKSADFNLGNISNQTLVKGDNVTLALWNASGSNIFNREFGGNVGIGKTNPATQLDVAGGINSSTLNVSGNAYLATQSGNVGIGTTAPNAKLELNVTSNIAGITTNGTINAPVLNTTNNNLTISSASGSVIIRLG